MVSIKITPIKANVVLPNLQRIIDEEIAREAKAVKREYESTTKTWKHKPDFEATGSETTASVNVGTDDKIYGYVDLGTGLYGKKKKKYPIEPVRAKALAFNAKGFRAKTTPNKITARAGRAATAEPTVTKKVMHPGIKSRNFSKLILERSRKRFAKNFQKRLQMELRRKL